MLDLALALLGFALAAGFVTGAVAARRRDGAPGIGAAFGLYLGALAMLVSTRAGTLDAVPLTLVAATVIGGGPFWLAYRMARRLRR